MTLSHHNLLDLHVFTIDEAEHVNARRSLESFADAAVDGLAAQDAAIEVDDLQGGFAGIVDNPAAVAHEGESF